MTCRDEILECIAAIERSTGRKDFTPQEIVDRMRQSGTTFEDSTIRTHITSRLCSDAPAHHGTRYADLIRVADGVYRRNPAARSG